MKNKILKDRIKEEIIIQNGSKNSTRVNMKNLRLGYNIELTSSKINLIKLWNLIIK